MQCACPLISLLDRHSSYYQPELIKCAQENFVLRHTQLMKPNHYMFQFLNHLS